MTKQNELPWVAEARKNIGEHEIRGRRHNRKIIKWLKKLGAWWSNDEVPWCGTFIAHCLTVADRPIPKHWYRAKAYRKAGTRLSRPAYGSIGIKGRKGGGHVFIIVGISKCGKYVIGLGGNQSNAVNLRKFLRKDVTDYIWVDKKGGVPSLPYPSRYNLPVYDDRMKLSASEV